ncbi:hypothetical protein HBI76_008380 [Parastagonospora nodorum]|nr:hypothetical protein HBI76_008380 [Parastagonospora nodorum]
MSTASRDHHTPWTPHGPLNTKVIRLRDPGPRSVFSLVAGLSLVHQGELVRLGWPGAVPFIVHYPYCAAISSLAPSWLSAPLYR